MASAHDFEFKTIDGRKLPMKDFAGKPVLMVNVASFCGLTGLKVTVGRVSTWGIVPLSMTLDTPGPLARTVEDTALLYEAISGPDPRDPTTRGTRWRVILHDPEARRAAGEGGRGGGFIAQAASPPR